MAIRVSTDGQNVAAQVAALQAAGAEKCSAKWPAGSKLTGHCFARRSQCSDPAIWRLMLIALGGLSEFERDLIRARTTDDRERAKERGVRMGRPCKLTNHLKREATRRRDSGYETLAESRAKLQLSPATIRLGFFATGCGGRLEDRKVTSKRRLKLPNLRNM